MATSALRTTAMLQALERARAAVPAVGELDPTLGGRFASRFDDLAGEVEDGLADGADPERAAELLQLGEDLIGETLAFLGGAAARKYALDFGVTSLADAWLDQLSDAMGLPRVGVVIPASTEFTGMLTHVVRLRLPSEGVWGLPVAVHEYGHFLASVFARRELKDGLRVGVLAVEERLREAAQEHELPKLYLHGHELFADAVAAAVVGPAYVRHCIHDRFDPALAARPDVTHPAPVRRVRLQLKVLERIAAQNKTGYLPHAAATAGQEWRERLAAAGVDPEPPADTLLDPLEDELVELLDDPTLKKVRYSDQRAAQALALELLEPGAEADSAAVALNAAWVRRLDHGTPLDEITAACERLVRGALGRG